MISLVAADVSPYRDYFYGLVQILSPIFQYGSDSEIGNLVEQPVLESDGVIHIAVGNADGSGPQRRHCLGEGEKVARADKLAV